MQLGAVTCIALLMSPVFAFCLAPNAARFFEEHKALDYRMDPKLAAMTAIDLSDRVEYGATRTFCPKQIKKGVTNFLKLAVMKKLSILYVQNNLFVFAAATLPEIFEEALSPKAMGYRSVREAMASAISTAPANNVDCESIDKAAELYSQYTYSRYVSDVCKGGNTLKDILALVKPPKSNGGAIAVEDFEAARHVNYFMENYLKSEHPNMCYPCLEEWMRTAKLNEDSILAYSIAEVMKECPITYQVGNKTMQLSKMEGGVAFLTDGETEVPAFSTGEIFQNLLNDSIFGPFPGKDDDMIIELKPGATYVDSSESPKKLSVSLLASIASLAILGYFVWRRRDEGA